MTTQNASDYKSQFETLLANSSIELGEHAGFEPSMTLIDGATIVIAPNTGAEPDTSNDVPWLKYGAMQNSAPINLSLKRLFKRVVATKTPGEDGKLCTKDFDFAVNIPSDCYELVTIQAGDKLIQVPYFTKEVKMKVQVLHDVYVKKYVANAPQDKRDDGYYVDSAKVKDFATFTVIK